MLRLHYGHASIVATLLLAGVAGCSAADDSTTAAEPTSSAPSAVVANRLPPGSIGSDTIAPDPAVALVRPHAMAPQAATTTRRIAILMVHFGTPDSATPEDIARRAFTNPDSMKAHYAEDSFGKLNIEGDVFGWYQIDPVPDCDVGRIGELARAAADAGDVDLSVYDHLLYYFTSIPTCTFGGLGEVGVPASPARQTWYNGWFDTYVSTHELGHNLGFWHSRSYQCQPSVIAPEARCIFNEYGDPFDPMGSSTAHFAAYQKSAQGWFAPCGVVTASKSGVFSIAPIEKLATGAQALRIPMSASLCPSWLGSCSYYVEYRQPIGVFDGGPSYVDSPMHQGVLVHAATSTLDTSGQSGLLPTGLLDMRPARGSDFPDFQDARLAVGQSFRDSSGLEIAVQSASPTAVQVAVGIPNGSGSPVCLDGTVVAQDPACNNRVRDHGETDVDCGGPCVPCDAGRRCSAQTDCWSRICTGGVCQPRVTCDDGLKNGTETDVDCGGTCGGCRDSQTCNVAADCLSGQCSGGFCQSAQIQATLRVYSDWTQGFCGDFTLTNTGSTPVVNWKVESRFADSTFSGTWNARYTAIGNNLVDVTPLDSNGTIWPHSTATTGFCATKTGPNYRPRLLWVASDQ